MRTKKGASVQSEPTFIEAARKAQIIESALNVIGELGFANASLAAIARHAGISKGVIGYYFATKDDLIRAAMDHFYGSGHIAMMAELDKAKTPVELLHKYIHSNLEFISNNRAGAQAIGEIVSNFRAPDGTLFYKIQDTEPLIAGTEAMFIWGQQTGDFRAFDTRVMAVTLRAAVDSFGTQLVANPDLDVAAYANELAGLFLHAARNTK